MSRRFIVWLSPFVAIGGIHCTVDGNVGKEEANASRPLERSDASDFDAKLHDAAFVMACDTELEQLGEWVALAPLSATAPEATGGVIVPGTYVLKAAYLDPVFGRGTQELRETLVVVGTSMGTYASLKERRGSTGGLTDLPARHEEGVWNEGLGSLVLMTPRCPKEGLGNSGRYTATASTLTFHGDGSDPVLEFLRVK
jgi:hypothetical protein